jgi:hypothetical protein
MRYCPECAARLKTTSSRGGIPRRECPECADDRDDWGRYGGNCRQVVADGGRPGVGVGDRVKDLDSEADDELLVVDTHATEAAAFAIDGLDATVADLNPGYPPEDRVVEAVYLEEVHGTVEAWRTAADLREAVAVGAINSYSFPASRLGATDEEAGGEMEAWL